ncbi:MAG: hypothetical protein Unbinned1322contig1000_24 [Prokaryotic dsDNA virus sp.]|nr:hypothetical protein [Aequorivita sp.]QDP57280.1 MAG: hypothetical protein Unbinned1322contig1000_24 [Prokaryotic dsDNA virus sp.]|tara:strand:+ start:8635 stop:8979 length:345 start_codon:yes stop_codon:yes gene_type:complete
MKNFKEGQKAWNAQYGKVIITLSGREDYPIRVEDSDDFTQEGKLYIGDKHPLLFHSKQDMIDYFTNLKENETYIRWVNLYNNGEAYTYPSEKLANNCSDSNRVECRKIEWTVGV